jgi:hypothetical protein
MKHATTELAEKILISMTQGKSQVIDPKATVKQAWELARELHSREKEELSKINPLHKDF